MKLKRDQIIMMNLLKYFKGILFSCVLLTICSLSAQDVEVELFGGPAMEQGTQTTIFRIYKTGLFLAGPITIDYTLSGTADEADDYQAIGNIVIPNGDTEVFVIVTPIDDNDVEGDQDIEFSLDPTVSYTVGTNNSATAIIEDNDVGILTLNLDTAINNGFEPEAPEGASPQIGQFRLDSDKRNETGSTVLVTFEVTGSATPGPGVGAAFDYDFTGAINAANNMITLPTNNQFRNINVVPWDDTVGEPDKTVTIRLTGTNNPLFTIGTADMATVTITDDDCLAGTTAPTLNGSTATERCDEASVNLNTFIVGGAASAPANTTLRWSTISNPTDLTDLLGSAIVTTSDEYYGLYWDAANTCFSQPTQVDLVFSTSPSAGIAVTGITRCNDTGFGSSSINLNNAITGEDTGGNWAYISGGTGDPVINGSDVVNFNGDDADTYVFEYTVVGTAPCLDSSVQVSIVAEPCDPCFEFTTAPTFNNNDREFCDVNVVNLDNFINNNGPSGSAERWSTNANPTEAQLLNSDAISSSGTYYAVFASGSGATFCASPPSNGLLISLNDSPSAGANANGAACNNPTTEFGATLLDLDTLLAVGVSPGTWDFTSGPQTLNPNANNAVQFRNRQAGTYVYTYTTTSAIAPCVDDSAVFTITVTDCDPCVAGNIAPVLDTDTPTVSCDVFTASFNDYTNSVPPTDTTLVWSTDSDPENTNAHLTAQQANSPPTVGGTYFGFFYDDVNTCASPTLQIDLALNISPTLDNVTGAERCDTGSVVLTATAMSGTDNATINWYESETSDDILGMGPSFTTPIISSTTTYYAEATFNGCISERKQAIATIAQQPSAGVTQNNGNASGCSDGANGPTVLDLDDLISGQDAGMWTYSSGPLPNFEIQPNNLLNFEGQPDGEYVFTYTTSGAQAPCNNLSSEITITVNDCDIDTDLDGLFDGVEAELGTDPTDPDTDDDGINDGDEVGLDVNNPEDEDEDGIIDARDSNVLDSDFDGVVDQKDPANENPCVPSRENGICDFDEDDVPDVDDPEPDNPCVPDINHPNCNPDPVDLEVTKEVDDFNALIGDEITFLVTVKNLDPNSRSRNIIVGELLEDGFEYIDHTASVGTYDLQNGEWSILEIAPLANQTLSILVRIIENGTYENTAELLDSFPLDDNPANDRANISLPIELPEGVNLVLEKSVSLGFGKERLETVTGLINSIQPEVEVIYFLKVINKSMQDIVSNIRVVDVFTNNNDVDFEIIDPEDDIPTDTTFDIESGVWLINKGLAVGEEIELFYRVVYKSKGVVLNTAVIESSTPRESTINDQDSSSNAKVEITSRNEVEIGILYNQFSPNNDGLNDDLKVNFFGKDVDGNEFIIPEENRKYSIQIFNRYGNLVYDASKNDEVVWDGSWKGKDSPDGTYFYTMNLAYRLTSDAAEIKSVQKGWIQLIR